MSKQLSIVLITVLICARASGALVVISSGGFASAVKILAPQYQQLTAASKTPVNITLEYGPSMGDTVNAIPNRLQRGEYLDVLLMVGTALTQLVEQGLAFHPVELADSFIAAAVKEGSPVPDISTEEAFVEAVLAAESIAYSDSASGVYLQDVLFPRLGIWEEIKNKSFMVPATPVGEYIAEGKASLGFQEHSELLPIPGITVVGLIPESVQKDTKYSAGIATISEKVQESMQFIEFLASPKSAAIIKSTGLVPIK